MIEIVIKGPAKCGKTALQLLIHQALQDAGLASSLNFSLGTAPRRLSTLIRRNVRGTFKPEHTIRISTERT